MSYNLKNYPKVVTATIASGGTTSEEINLADFTLNGIFLPSTFDGTTITFTASPESGGTFVAVEDAAGSTYTLTTSGASKYIPITNLAIFSGLQYIKVVSGTSQSTTDTVLTLALRPL